MAPLPVVMSFPGLGTVSVYKSLHQLQVRLEHGYYLSLVESLLRGENAQSFIAHVFNH